MNNFAETVVKQSRKCKFYTIFLIFSAQRESHFYGNNFIFYDQSSSILKKSFTLSDSSLYFRLDLFRHSTVSKGRIRSRSAGAFRRVAFKGQTPVGTLREVGRRQSRRMDEKIQTSAASSNFRVVDHRSTGYRRSLDHG